MTIQKNVRLLAVTIGIFAFFACQSDQTKPIRSINPPSRYDLITADKVTQEDDDHPPILHNDGWEMPHPISGAVNSAGLEDSPFISPDGKALFFFYTPSSDFPDSEQINDKVTGIYFAEKSDNEWQEPVRVVLTEDTDLALDGCPFYQDNVLWFCSIRDGNFRDIDIWTAEWGGSEWGKITNAGEYLNQELEIEEMHINQDGSTLIYHKPDEKQINGYDLWEIKWEGDRWGAPNKLDPLNSPQDDSRPALAPNELELWFTRTHNGTPAIFRSQLVEGKWDDAELIISQFAGEPTIDNKGNIYFTHHFFQEGNMIEADIYVAEKKD
ncbi:MAG: hypothetical protein Q7J07_07050 [Pelolinea sp.]|nr:hypothetical protein [Pelolinea sp.]